MTLQVIVSSRALYAADTYIGDKGRIFYREDVGDLRLSDGITPGGIPLTGNSVTLIGDTEPLNPSSGTLWFNPATNQLKIYFDDDSSGWVDIAGSLQGLTSNNQSILSVDDGYDIIPAVDAGPSLGTPQKRFKSLHLSGNSLYIDDVRVTVNQNSELMVFDSQDNLTSIHSKEIYLGDQSDPIVLRKNDLTDRLEMVLYSGTVSEEVYSVSIGYTGSQGEIGYTGSQGIVGFTGSQGLAGTSGFMGSRGFTGSQGLTGFTGSQGLTGFTGSQGLTGFTGSQGDTGYTGSQGDVGYTGSHGDVGYTGSHGDTGYTGSQGDTGFVGSQGDTGYTGSHGDTGYTGSQGLTGFTGSEGFTGSQGEQGYTGSSGTDGIAGRDGYTGSQGDIGYTGSQGFTGSQGETGAALKIVGFVDTVEQLSAGYQGSLGDAYVVRSTLNLLVWDSQQWVNTGPVPGANVGLATRDTAGIVRIGDNININNGTISVPKGAGINKVVDIPDVNDAELDDGSLLFYNEGAARWETKALDLTNSVMDGGFY